MIKLTIPKSHIETFRKLFLEVDKDTRDRLLKAINSFEPTQSRAEIKKQVHEQFGLEPSFVDSLISILENTIRTHEGMGEKPEEFVESVSSSLKENGIASSDVVETLAKIIDKNGYLYVTTKASQLLYENQNVFYDCRVVTNITPVFSEPDCAQIKGYLTIHNLKIEYHTEPDHKNVFIAMDGDDLEKLKNAIERAQKKQQLLENNLKSSGAKIFKL